MEDEVIGAPAEAPVTEAPVVDTPAPEAPAPETPAEPQTRRDFIAQEMKKAATNRGKHAAYQPREQGKFVPGSPKLPESAPVTPPELPLPKSLKRDYEPHWNQTPAELRQAIIEREAAFEKGAQTWKSKAEQADAILQQFQPYEWMLRNEGATPQTAIAPLLQTAAILRTGTPAQKAQSVAQVMSQFGIPIEHIQAVMGQGQSNVLDPQYNQLAHEVQSLKQNLMQQEQMQSQRAMTVIQQFAADPKNGHFAAVQDKMLALLQTPQLLGQDVQFMSEREKLQLAYDTAVRLDPQLSAQVAAQQQAETQRVLREKAQAAAQAARSAAVQVTGAPGSPLAAPVNPNDRRSVIANALKAASR